MKKFYLLSLAALALTACTSDEIIDPVVGPNGPAESGTPISFDGGTGVITRAAKTGATAAEALNNNFVVYGFKTVTGTPSTQTVYDHYNVNYVTNTAGSTPSNSAGWEYVGQDFSALTSLTTTGNAQEIKYWDLAATQYDFIAFSAGGNTIIKTGTIAADNLLFSTVNNATLTTAAYTIQGSVDDLAEAFIADRVTAKKTATVKANLLYQYKDAIQFNFRSLSAKVRMAIYETIPGYSVKDVKFYVSSTDDAPTTTPALYAASATIPGGSGTMTVSFPTVTESATDYNKAHVSYAPTAPATNESKIQFSTLTYKAAEQLETAGDNYLGRTSSTASYAGDETVAGHAYKSVLPATVGALTLKVDYTLVAKDGSGETIDVKGATAVVPEKFCTWQPNYAYTYIFKITDKTSGTIGGDPAGLWPITFDAIVTETEDGIQETITEVTTPSITTYQKGKIVTVNDEYTAGDIYVSVDGTTALTSSNSKLYTVTIDASADQEITEASVENCIKNGALVVADGDLTATHACVATPTALQIAAGTVVSSYYTKNTDGNYEKCGATETAVEGKTYYEFDPTKATGYVVTDADGKKLTVTVSGALTPNLDAIPATAAPDGNELSIKCAKITAVASTNYVFVYDNGTTKTYKVIKVAAGS